MWTESTLHQFTGGWDGAGNPGSELSIDNGGHIYGSTAQGGAYGKGVVFALVGPNSSEVVLHAFAGGADGGTPLGPLTFDASGNIYGTAADGGSGYGLVFKLTPNRFKAGWTESVLYAFAYQDRIQPNGGVIFDAAGNSTAQLPTVAPEAWALCTSLRTTQTTAGAQACCTRSPASPMGMMLILRSSSTTPVISMAPPPWEARFLPAPCSS